MRFALLGNHPDGVQLAEALDLSGRHQVVVYTNAVPGAVPEFWGRQARRVNDLEEILADPTIEAVIVASHADGRPVHLRRALQSERHVLCVFPPDQRPEIAYEAALIQQDTGFLLYPLLPDRLHPAIELLADLMQATGPLGAFSLVEVEWSAPGPVLRNTEVDGHKLSFPAWDLLRLLGGEIVEVMGYAGPEEVPAEEPVLLAGRFEKGGLFRFTLLPRQPATFCRLTLIGSRGRAELVCPEGWRGPSRLTWSAAENETKNESWPGWNPWLEVIQHFEPGLTQPSILTEKGGVNWQDAVRMLELDDAARRSIEKRRSSLLEYPDASEDVGFKGTMTLVGCAVLWLVILLLIIFRGKALFGWVAMPLLAVFLILQLLRYLIPRKPNSPS